MDRVAFYRERVAHFKEQIARNREGPEWLEAGIQKHGEIDERGRLIDLTEELIEQYRATIAKLENVIAAYEARIADATRS